MSVRHMDCNGCEYEDYCQEEWDVTSCSKCLERYANDVNSKGKKDEQK